MNILLILLGWLLIIPAILLGPIVKLFPIDTQLPWTSGPLLNVLRAYKKYSAVSWLRRAISLTKNPKLVKQYIKILFNKSAIFGDHLIYMPRDVNELKAFHDVQTDHAHHRQRVADLKAGKAIESDFGPMIVVDDTVHDGNHRLAAYREAGISFAWVLQYHSDDFVRKWERTEAI